MDLSHIVQVHTSQSSLGQQVPESRQQLQDFLPAPNAQVGSLAAPRATRFRHISGRATSLRKQKLKDKRLYELAKTYPRPIAPRPPGVSILDTTNVQGPTTAVSPRSPPKRAKTSAKPVKPSKKTSKVMKKKASEKKNANRGVPVGAIGSTNVTRGPKVSDVRASSHSRSLDQLATVLRAYWDENPPAIQQSLAKADDKGPVQEGVGRTGRDIPLPADQVTPGVKLQWQSPAQDPTSASMPNNDFSGLHNDHIFNNMIVSPWDHLPNQSGDSWALTQASVRHLASQEPAATVPSQHDTGKVC